MRELQPYEASTAASLTAIATGAQAQSGNSGAASPGVVQSTPSPSGTSSGAIGLVQSVPTPNGTSSGIASPDNGMNSSNDLAPNGTPLASSQTSPIGGDSNSSSSALTAIIRIPIQEERRGRQGSRIRPAMTASRPPLSPKSLSPATRAGAVPAPGFRRTSQRKAAENCTPPAAPGARTPCNGNRRRAEHSERQPAFPRAFRVSDWRSTERYN